MFEGLRCRLGLSRNLSSKTTGAFWTMPSLKVFDKSGHGKALATEVVLLLLLSLLLPMSLFLPNVVCWPSVEVGGSSSLLLLSS